MVKWLCKEGILHPLIRKVCKKIGQKEESYMKNASRNEHVTAIILAAGVGSRLDASVAKQRITLLGKSIIARATESFMRCESIDSIVIVARAEDIDFVMQELHFAEEKLYAIIEGGDCRAESAKRGFLAIPPATTHIAIHDAARCLITPEDITAVVLEAKKHGAASAVSKVVDTVKMVSDGKIKETISRENLYFAETPQAFSVEYYDKALSAVEDLHCITDDNMLLEKIGIPVVPVLLSSKNPKITYINDLDYAEFLLKRRGENE